MDNGNNRRHVWLPQGNTPRKPVVKIKRENDTCKTSGFTAPRPSRRSLVFTVEKEETEAPNSQMPHSWSEKEIKFLVEHIALYWINSEVQETWPKFKNKEFWNASAKHVAKHSHCSQVMQCGLR